MDLIYITSQEKYASSIYSQTLHFKTCKLPGGCVSSSSLVSVLACLAIRAASSSSCTLFYEREDPSPTSTVKQRFHPIPASNNGKIMRLITNIKRYISRHVNYLGLCPIITCIRSCLLSSMAGL